MLENINQEKYGVINNITAKQIKFNLLWGIDYMLMDSNTFMGGIDGEEYENIISIFCNIWNSFEDNKQKQMIVSDR